MSGDADDGANDSGNEPLKSDNNRVGLVWVACVFN